ncbi:spore coat protein [Bacillus sp. FJAT-49736]|uniref:spore coat protein n=1 Tax=Bacillus sp. FJAT-49736 TaxID=2833582 RepID=UPI001BC932B2|nr:spore coat protein [Bacillus sp. FJAT-49736]MBS4173984.1 spore coat protein [Bacillus sp. FJAT-49736]
MNQLAWHESLELHELLTFQANCLIQLKMSVRKVIDHELHDLYLYSIKLVEKNLKDLLPYTANTPNEYSRRRNEPHFFAGDLLGAAKTSIKMYASAIAETTPSELRSVFHRHLNIVISWHSRIFEYMNNNSLYPALNLQKILEKDAQNVQNALLMKY